MEILEPVTLLNPLATAAAALAVLVAGMLWTSPFLFGKSWVRLSGIRPGDVRPEHQRLNSIVAVFVAIATAVLLGLLASHVRDTPLFYAAGFIWLFVMLTQLNAFVRRREPFALFLLATTRSLAMLMVGAAVFFFWS
jgi:hypothetical protein